jgi:TfoX/Sxy family transcriptional regulator of competence genes
MAYDEGQAQILRDALAELDGIAERKMFGGLCFTLNGHMLCGVHAKGGMARVGKIREPKALEIDGTRPLDFTGRPMGGMISLDDTAVEDDEVRDQWLTLALEFVRSLPPK